MNLFVVTTLVYEFNVPIEKEFKNFINGEKKVRKVFF